MNIEELIKNPRKLEDVFENVVDAGNKKLADLLVPYIKDPYLIFRYAQLVEDKVSSELEDIIAQDHFYSYLYAHNVLKGPFVKGEDTIATNGYSSYHYAKFALKNRFKKGEPTIIKEKNWLKSYMDFLREINKLDEFLKDYPELNSSIKSIGKDIYCFSKRDTLKEYEEKRDFEITLEPKTNVNESIDGKGCIQEHDSNV
jgi:hypothetical protein